VLIQSEILGLLNDVLHQQGRLRKAGRQLMYHCPFCADKNLTTQKLEIAMDGPKIGSYHCWRCNSKGRTFGSLLKKLNAPNAYRQKLFQMTGDIRLARNNTFKKDDSIVSLPPEFISLATPRQSPEYKNAMAYLIRRRITMNDILRYNIGYCENGDYEYRIIVPSYDAEGVLNFFIGRRYYDIEGCIAYKKPETPMNNIIGLESFINWDEDIILVEGIFNAITIRRNAIPLFGKFPSNKLYETLHYHNINKIYVCLDNDANDDAFKLCKRLLKQEGITPYFVNLIGGKDANELGFNKTWNCIRRAIEIDDTILLAKEQGRDIYSL
jgi:DNA primase